MRIEAGEIKWMRRAIQLAKKGISGVSPNPMVGCVIVKNHKAVGEGFHVRYGSAHAEINAIEDAGSNCKDATLYVNLEPCCHWGKTPPCTEAILSAGISRVVAALPDPNPLVRGKGFRQLQRKGVQVKVGVLEQEARDLNRAFFKFITIKKPYVILKSAISLDGKIATSTGESRWITSAVARAFSTRLRTQVDAILVGAETVRMDNPELTSHGMGRNPVRVVVSASGNLPPRAKIFNGTSPTWIFSNSAPHLQRGLEQKAEWFSLKQKKEKFNFADVLKQLAKRGISKVLIEGGGETAASALESGEVDEIYFFIAPLLIGGREAKTPFEGKGFGKLKEALRLTEVTTKKIGNDLLVNARVQNV